jgi:hypothetical protein
MSDLFGFWAGVPGDVRVHPRDEDTFKRASHHFELACLPTNYLGPLRIAPVVLLFLSPGFEPEDIEQAKTRDGQEYYLRQRSGNAHLPTEGEHKGAWKWLMPIIRQFGVSLSEVASKVAILNIAPYKSKRFHDHGLLAALPSSHAAIDYAQSVLFPEAEDEAGRRVVVCLRSPDYWGLSEREDGPYGRALYAPPRTRRGIMRHGPLRESIVAVVQGAVGRTTAPDAARAQR